MLVSMMVCVLEHAHLHVPSCTYCVCTFTYAVYPVQVLSVVFSAGSELRNWLLYYSIIAFRMTTVCSR